MIAVQFYGEESVLKAVENRDCPRWAMFSGRQFLFKCDRDNMTESIQMLTDILEALDRSGTVATYTLKFYEDAGKITEKTPCDGSFNFRLVSEEQRQETKSIYAAGSNKVLEAVERLNARLDALEAEAGEEIETEPQGISGVLMGLLKEPQKITELVNVFTMLSGKKHMGAIAGTPPAQANGSDEEKISQAIAILKQHDPSIADHLLKLAGIATNNPAAFKYLLSMLDSQ